MFECNRTKFVIYLHLVFLPLLVTNFALFLLLLWATCSSMWLDVEVESWSNPEELDLVGSFVVEISDSVVGVEMGSFGGEPFVFPSLLTSPGACLKKPPMKHYHSPL